MIWAECEEGGHSADKSKGETEVPDAKVGKVRAENSPGFVLFLLFAPAEDGGEISSNDESR